MYLLLKAHSNSEHDDGPDFAVIDLGTDLGLIEIHVKAARDAKALIKPMPDYLEWFEYSPFWFQGDFALEGYDFAEAMARDKAVLVQDLPPFLRSDDIVYPEDREDLGATELRQENTRLVVNVNDGEIHWEANIKGSDIAMETVSISMDQLKGLQIYPGLPLDDDIGPER
jgi:hypothetical protein